MLRYVEVGDQVYDEYNQFAWVDTSTDRFLDVDGHQLFDSWEEFEEIWRDAPAAFRHRWPLQRFRSLFPMTVIEIKPEEVVHHGEERREGKEVEEVKRLGS